MAETKILTEEEIISKVEFLSSHRCNHTPHKYIDITGDLIAGTLLSQIMYWFADGKNRVSIYKDGHYWIAKRREDWMSEIRITQKQYDCAIKKLTGEIEPTEEEKKKKWNKGKRREKKYDMDNRLVEVKTYHFYGVPTTHIRPITENINRKIDEWKKSLEEEIRSKNNNACSPNLPNGNLVNSPNSNLEINETENSYNTYNNINISTENTNIDYSTETTDKYALENVKKSFSKGDMYAPVSGKQEAALEKQNRYISPDYTEEQLREHIKSVVHSEVEQYVNDWGTAFSKDDADEFIDIVCAFNGKYKERYGENHYVMPDKTIRSVVRRYLQPPEEMDGVFEIEKYEELMEKYFSTNFNQQGKYDGEITLSFPHFMSDTIRGHLANRCWN